MKKELMLVSIKEFNGGRYGRMGKYIAIIKPHYFKNGNLIKSQFEMVQYVETIKQGYRYGTATHTETIDCIIAEDFSTIKQGLKAWDKVKKRLAN